MRTIDEMKALLKIDGITWEEEQSVNAMERIWMNVDELKALLKLDGMTWEKIIYGHWRHAMALKHPNFTGTFAIGYGDTLEEAWETAWEAYNNARR